MSRTIRCISLAIILASLMLSSASVRVRAQDKKAEDKPAPPPAPKVAPPIKGLPRLPGRTKAADPRFTDDVTIPTDRESKRLI